MFGDDVDICVEFCQWFVEGLLGDGVMVQYFQCLFGLVDGVYVVVNMIWFKVILGDFEIFVVFQDDGIFGNVYIGEMDMYVVVWCVVLVEDYYWVQDFDVWC